MGKKNKLAKFSENMTSKNVIEQGKPIFETIQGNWTDFFGNNNQIVVELACGWGEYTISLAEKFADKNFIGIDIKGDRIWKGSQYALKNGLTNVAFLRIHIIEILDLFGENELDEIWLTFPDPRPKDRDEKHRLSNKSFLEKYRHILKPDGWFRFKTDNTELFEYTLQVLTDFKIKDHEFTFDLYNSPLMDEHHGIKTKYERIWTEKGEKIKYMKFRFA
ncbi:tRNA (guanine-N(7)-)-methyltransferase [Ekhidna lutea]|uniref:tRNA (guanine-N(7)-)-methyltransferase n=1 Tax=Ekhidna lutea TaxID=447679 RepID=A0A239GUX8_EKHLU|nr:tRNA (guanosine(46)-N7)-methyltransferase TrmB [Ekhidna lutea]SNS72313.1 tRNA (guanine-N(7)-)-methyltransferase [Ekhidna lutea]